MQRAACRASFVRNQQNKRETKKRKKGKRLCIQCKCKCSSLIPCSLSGVPTPVVIVLLSSSKEQNPVASAPLSVRRQKERCARDALLQQLVYWSWLHCTYQSRWFGVAFRVSVVDITLDFEKNLRPLHSAPTNHQPTTPDIEPEPFFS